MHFDGGRTEDMAEQHELEKNALGLGESVVMGVAGTAPAFSIAATTATIIAAVTFLWTPSQKS